MAPPDGSPVPGHSRHRSSRSVGGAAALHPARLAPLLPATATAPILPSNGPSHGQHVQGLQQQQEPRRRPGPYSHARKASAGAGVSPVGVRSSSFSHHRTASYNSARFIAYSPAQARGPPPPPPGASAPGAAQLPPNYPPPGFPPHALQQPSPLSGPSMQVHQVPVAPPPSILASNGQRMSPRPRPGPGPGPGPGPESSAPPQPMLMPVPADQARPPGGASSIPDPESILDPTSGRSFHGYKPGKYFLPNDSAEQDRLDLQYAGFHLLLDQRLFHAPLTHVPARVLDIGTGTGVWALEFALAFPAARVVGADLSRIQPRHPPPNCDFVRADAEDEQAWRVFQGGAEQQESTGHGQQRSGLFDYIHLRHVYTCFDRPRDLVRRARDNLQPGGWIEFQDGSAEVGCVGGEFAGSALETWYSELIHGAAAMGRDIQKARHWKGWLIEAGFINVHEVQLQFPINPWPADPKYRQAGLYMMRNLLDGDGLRGISWRMLGAAGWSPAQIDAFLPRVRDDIANKDMQTYFHYYVVYGQKPFT